MIITRTHLKTLRQFLPENVFTFHIQVLKFQAKLEKIMQQAILYQVYPSRRKRRTIFEEYDDLKQQNPRYFELDYLDAQNRFQSHGFNVQFLVEDIADLPLPGDQDDFYMERMRSVYHKLVSKSPKRQVQKKRSRHYRL
jgi:hypothetical protein